jgi:Flp pilus assembly protein TadG
MLLPKLRSAKSAQALVEFALLVPVFFMILIGLLDFGRAGFYYVAASALARNGARYGAAYRDGTGFTDAAVLGFVMQQANAETINISQPGACGTNTPPSPLTSCYQPASGQAYLFIDRSNFSTLPKVIKVSVVYRFDATTPMVRALVGTIYIVATSSMQTEF